MPEQSDKKDDGKLKNEKESDWEDQQEGPANDLLSDDQDLDIDVLDRGSQGGENSAQDEQSMMANVRLVIRLLTKKGKDSLTFKMIEDSKEKVFSGETPEGINLSEIMDGFVKL